ncbi:MAG: protein kinase [Deltaproteobacteria bacterium]|nr:protein kinase [Deltaproteobacteria bacterium]
MSDFDLSGTVLDGRYKVISPISEGAMGSVYRGERVKLGRAVAIKVMHEALPDELASRQRFEREAKLMAMLEHPHCVSVIDFGVHDDKPFLVMELVRGTSLQQILDKDHRIELPRTAAILKQVLSGLAHAHEIGIIHRDIKPANIMVTEQTGIGEQVRILDFGLARLTEGSTKLTTGIVVGTPNYMAPEQCKGGNLDGRTDLYACGVMLFEMLTGRKPFLADDPITVVRKHISEPPPRLADIAPGMDFGDLEAVVAKALAKDAKDRFADATAMAAAIDSALKKGAAQVFARAVPQAMTGPGSAPQVATPSGWTVPSAFVTPITEPSSPMPPQDSLSIAQQTAPLPPPAPSPPPAAPFAPPPTPPRDPSAPHEPAFTAAPAPVLAEPSAPVPAEPSASGRAERTAPVRAPRGLPLSRKQLAIAGGGLLALIVVIAVVASGHKGSKPAVTPPIVQGSAGSAAADDPVAAALAHATELAQAGDPEAALQSLVRARKQNPESAALAVAAGKLYFNKLWWTDGIKSFRDAIKLDPSLRSDPELIKTVLRGFNTTPDVDDRIESFLREDLGETARPYLEETAKSHPNKQIRARAAAELRHFR